MWMFFRILGFHEARIAERERVNCKPIILNKL